MPKVTFRSALAEFMKSVVTDHLKCVRCGKPCDPKQTTQTNPLCPKHEEEQRQREEFMSAGRGQDPETAKEDS